MGVIVGFLGAWLFSSTPTGTEGRQRAREMGHTAQRATQQMASEAKGTGEGGRSRSMG